VAFAFAFAFVPCSCLLMSSFAEGGGPAFAFASASAFCPVPHTSQSHRDVWAFAQRANRSLPSSRNRPLDRSCSQSYREQRHREPPHFVFAVASSLFTPIPNPCHSDPEQGRMGKTPRICICILYSHLHPLLHLLLVFALCIRL